MAKSGQNELEEDEQCALRNNTCLSGRLIGSDQVTVGRR